MFSQVSVCHSVPGVVGVGGSHVTIIDQAYFFLFALTENSISPKYYVRAPTSEVIPPRLPLVWKILDPPMRKFNIFKIGNYQRNEITAMIEQFPSIEPPSSTVGRDASLSV